MITKNINYFRICIQSNRLDSISVFGRKTNRLSSILITIFEILNIFCSKLHSISSDKIRGKASQRLPNDSNDANDCSSRLE